jgi:uncharacterized phage protein (TIGR01671 family)
MREIKFRAKAIENIETHLDGIEIGDWVYGYYYFDRANMTGIIVTDLLEESGGIGSGIMQCHIKVDPETVGEYTGLPDKKGKEIYEGDIVQCIPYVEFYREVVFIGSKYWLINKSTDNLDVQFPLEVVKTSHYNSKVIGNIYENPELLKEG